jgi:hypothetical protein
MWKSTLKPVTYWKISAKWASKRLNCTPQGILRDGGCGGHCCKMKSFWPPSSNKKNPAAGCPKLGPNGCTFTPEQKPVTCHIYPMKLNKNNTLVLHHRITQGVVCENCWLDAKGPMLVEAMRPNWVALFGEGEADRIIKFVRAGMDVLVPVPKKILKAYEREEQWYKSNSIPKARK